jgi:hypothetical protein
MKTLPEQTLYTWGLSDLTSADSVYDGLLATSSESFAGSRCITPMPVDELPLAA